MPIAAQMFDGLLYGYLGIILYMILTGCGLPMPEEVAIIAGGALAASGQLDPWLTLGSLLCGALLGDCVMYFIGRHFGRRILKANRFGAAFLTPEREQRVEALLSRHGSKVLFVARFLVGIRGPIYITAGILKMPFRMFVLADLVSASAVVSLFFGLSYYYGQTIVRIIHQGEGVFTLIAITLAVLGGGALFWYQLRRKRMPGMQILADAQVAASSDQLPTIDPAADRGAGGDASAVTKPTSSSHSTVGNGQDCSGTYHEDKAKPA
ncbi:MAG: DedA family protein [Pirellulales bacterium]|nr:DedA family protein [Pirellulales bacterium]